MPEASLHPAALLSEAAMQRERWRGARAALGDVGVAARWLTENVRVQPQNSPPVSGMGGSCHCRSFLGLAFWFTCAPSLCKFPFPINSPCKMPVPHMKWRR